MQFEAKRRDLLKAVARADAVTAKRSSTMPILRSVRMTAESDLVLLSGDGEMMLQQKTGADVQSKGTLCVPAGRLQEVLQVMQEDAVILKQDPGRNYLKIRCGQWEVELAGSDSEEYPDLMAKIQGGGFPLPGADLHQALEQCAYAASADETRYNLNGVCMDADPEKERLVFVATDGHRMALSSMTLPEEAKTVKSLILPRNPVKEISRMAKDEESLQLRRGDTGIALEGGNAELALRLIDGEFPAWKAVLPKEYKAKAVVKSEDLIQLMQYAMATSDERSRAVVLEFQEGALKARSHREDECKAEAAIEAEYGGDALSIGLNARYLREAVEHLHAERVVLEVKDPNSPLLIAPEGENGDEDRALQPQAVVMPMRI